jgi:hypothetical protein
MNSHCLSATLFLYELLHLNMNLFLFKVQQDRPAPSFLVYSTLLYLKTNNYFHKIFTLWKEERQKARFLFYIVLVLCLRCTPFQPYSSL